MNHLISEDYKNTIKKLHSTTKWGADGHMWAPQVSEMIDLVGAKTVLDYGCGKGTLKSTLKPNYPGVTFYEYDPAIPGKDCLPDAPVDLVVCTDVLEHIEPSKLASVLLHLQKLTGKAAYIRIDLGPARTILPDGRNAHLIIETAHWWTTKIGCHLPVVAANSTKKKLEIKVVFGGEVIDLGDRP